MVDRDPHQRALVSLVFELPRQLGRVAGRLLEQRLELILVGDPVDASGGQKLGVGTLWHRAAHRRRCRGSSVPAPTTLTEAGREP